MIRALSVILALTFMFLSALLPLSAKADALHSNEEMRKFFEIVAIGKKPRAKIVKWTKAPTIRLETMTVGPRDAATGRAVPIPTQTDISYYQFLADHISELNELTDLNMRLMPRDIGSGGDIVISIAPRVVMSALPIKGAPQALLRDLLGPGRCFFLVWPDREWRIIRARIVINSLLNKNHIKHCFVEELTQAMGLPHDSDMLRPSIFNESSMEPNLTDLDHIIVRALYDPRMIRGSGLGAVREVANDIIQSYSDQK